jgi:hypothetical protein
MKVILIGYEGSKKILSASSYFLKKYLVNSENNFDIYFLNYGNFSQKLFCGTYIELDSEQKGGADSWSSYILNYLKTIEDEFVIFALDDYFLSKSVDMDTYNYLLEVMKLNDKIGCSKLGITPACRPMDYTILEGDLYQLNRHANYSVTTQFNIWRKEVLMDILRTVSNPWEFEIKGSDVLNKTNEIVIGSTNIPFKYPEASSISSRHPNKVSVLGNQKNDIEDLINLGYLNESELIMGQWKGEVESYIKYKDNPIASITSNCNDPAYYTTMVTKCLGDEIE